ncbi:MAG: hypothetical protein WCK78_18805 [Paludibacter sp.]
MKPKDFTFSTTKVFRIFVMAIISLATTVSLQATTLYFFQTTSTDWATASNWSTNSTTASVGSAVPTASDAVIINSNKTVVIASGTTVSVETLKLNAGTTSLTNNGTLTISPTSTTGSALTVSGAGATFDNEGTLTVTSANQTTASNTISISGNGTAASSLIFNGTSTLAAKSTFNIFAVAQGATATIGGTGFTIGSLASPSLASVFSVAATSTSLTVNSGTTINMYIGGSASGFYLSNSSSFTNNGNINIYAGTGVTGTAVHGFQLSNATSNAICTFTNAGTLSVTGFQQPAIFGGTLTGTNYCKFNNTGTATINTSDVAGALGIYSTTLPNAFTNSGTLNLYGYANSIKLSDVTGQTFTNTGTINITKGPIISTGTIAASTAPTLNNNSGGKINFNYGVSDGSTLATTATVKLNNNNGATINGSCTFGAGSLVTNSGSTLSPGDYSGGVSGYGIMVINPSAAGTKFPLNGTVLMQMKGTGSSNAGTLFDRIICTEIDCSNTSMTVSVDYTSYTPALNDYNVLIYAATSKTALGSTSMPRGWSYTTTATNEAATYYPSVPGAPTSVVATAGNAQASVAFVAPVSDGGANITSYTVTSSPGGFTATGSTSPLKVLGLTNGTAYTFTATATNIRGTGSGTTSSSVTPSATANNINVSSSTSIGSLTLTPVSDVVVGNGALLTINAPTNINSLTIAGGGQVTNTSSLIASAITINSDGTNGTGTYNDYGGSTSVTSATVKQYLSSSSSRNWYMSSPVSGASSLPTVDGIGSLTLYSYPESDTNQENGANGYAAGAVWNTVSGATTMAFGTGYIVKPSAATSTVTFSGAGLNTGNQTISGLSYTSANPKHGFNLIGNPYPSYLNVLPSISANAAGIEPTVWYRTRDAAGYYHCETVNSTDGFGTNSSLTGRVTGYIPPMQGFWVRTKLNNQSIALSNSNRSHTTTVTQPGVGSVPTTPLKAPTLKNETYGLLGLNVFNGITGDETIIKFYSGATNNLDAYDSGKMSNSNVNIPELFTVVDGSQLAINTMNSIPYDSEIALGFTTGKSGDFTINTSLISNFAEGIQILLKDNIDPLNPVIPNVFIK